MFRNLIAALAVILGLTVVSVSTPASAQIAPDGADNARVIKKESFWCNGVSAQLLSTRTFGSAGWKMKVGLSGEHKVVKVFHPTLRRDWYRFYLVPNTGSQGYIGPVFTSESCPAIRRGESIKPEARNTQYDPWESGFWVSY